MALRALRAECVQVAITGLVEQEPDMVIFGGGEYKRYGAVNSGANLGDNV